MASRSPQWRATTSGRSRAWMRRSMAKSRRFSPAAVYRRWSRDTSDARSAGARSTIFVLAAGSALASACGVVHSGGIHGVEPPVDAPGGLLFRGHRSLAVGAHEIHALVARRQAYDDDTPAV